MAEQKKILKVTQDEGVFYYETTKPLYEEGGIVDAQRTNRVHDFVVLSEGEIPEGTTVRSEAELGTVLTQEPAPADYTYFKVVLKNEPTRYFQIPPHRVGVSSSVLWDAREDDQIDAFQRVKTEEIPAQGYDYGWEHYDAFRLLMAEALLGLRC